MKMRFALYFIPNGSLYERGSSVVGYDIRAQRTVAQPDFIDPAWTASCGAYGFHITVTDAIDADDSQLPEITAKVERLLQCFRPSNTYSFAVKGIDFWRPDSNIAVIELVPSRHAEMLHNVLVASLHPMGSGSKYYNSYRANPDRFLPDTPADIARVEQFFAPYIFDDFVPHFTCIEPFAGSAGDRIEAIASLRSLFSEVQKINFDRIALVVQPEDKPHFSIVREFNLNDR